MLTKFRDVGFLMWHGQQKETRQLVVLDVQWMLDRMTSVLCQRSIEQKYAQSARLKDSWSELQARGRLSIELLPELWPSLELWERQSVLKYMSAFGTAACYTIRR